MNIDDSNVEFRGLLEHGDLECEESELEGELLDKYNRRDIGSDRTSLLQNAWGQRSVLFVFLLISAQFLFWTVGISGARKAEVDTNEKLMKALDLDSGISTSDETPTASLGRPSFCDWSPDEPEECHKAIHALVCPRRQHARIPRMLYAGDSTMKKLLLNGRVHETQQTAPKDFIEKSGSFECFKKEGQRCERNLVFDLPFRTNHTWFPPGKLEGPLLYGRENPYCTDCAGCFSRIMLCEPVPNQPKPDIEKMSPSEIYNWTYATHFGMEFARDVEIQTDMFPTSQENVAHYLHQTWNRPAILETWEKPICVINTGHHDVIIETMTQELYVENVRWYLRLMDAECQNILWIATNAPASDRHPQKIVQTKEWGHAVRDMLQEDRILSEKSLYIDVYEASLTYPHKDNGRYRSLVCSVFFWFCISLVSLLLFLVFQFTWKSGGISTSRTFFDPT